MPDDSVPPVADDVRMRGFFRRATVEAAWNWIDEQTRLLPAESIPLCQALTAMQADAEVILVSGGSSVGQENPVSCLCAYDFFAGQAASWA